MTTALVRHAPAPVAVEQSPLSFTEMLHMGNELVRTGFLADHIKNGAQAAAIILAGRELGMPPMRALRSLVLVKGKVTEYADSQLSRFKSDGGRAKFVTLDETKAVLWLKHPNGDEHTETFTLEDAKRAGLMSNANYQKFPKPMLRSRGITAGMKSIGWEGGAGVYDPAELAPEEIADADVSEVPEPITSGQSVTLGKVMTSHVFTERERARAAKVDTKMGAMKALDWALATVKERKAAEKAEAESGADGVVAEPEDDGDGEDRE